MTQSTGSWTRLARRRSWPIRVSVVIAVLAVLVSGLVGARYVIGWWAGPRSIGVGTEGADALAVSRDGGTLYAANWDEGSDSGGITVVNLATAGRASGSASAPQDRNSTEGRRLPVLRLTCHRCGPRSASAEDLAGHRRSKVQRYLILLREWPLRRLGEDH
jgi:hypothetical protein